MPGKRFTPSLRHLPAVVLPSLFLALMPAAAGPAHALTDYGKTDNQEPVKDDDKAANPDATEDEQLEDAKPGLPVPDSLIKKPDSNTDSAEDKVEDKAEEPVAPAEIIFDMNQLPEPVKKLRVAIVEAAASGDIERLRPLLKNGNDATQVSIGDAPEDPIAALKSLSGDNKEGREVLGILLDIISTGAAHVEKGTPNELYVWPYFAEKPLASLTPPEIVELYRIVTAADVADMKEFGSYNFYRIGISPDGKWKFFVAGD
jgi:hypothetical protein